MKILLKLLMGLAGLSLVACGSSDSAETEIPAGFESVALTLETVTLIQWERVESAFRYRVEADGVELSQGVGNRHYVVHDGPFENLRINASSFQGEDLGPASLESMQRVERLVLRWDEAAFVRPFLGLRTEDGDGGSGSMAMELAEPPHVIGRDPAQVKLALFGEAVEAEDGRIVPSPFSFDGRNVIEHGPFIRLNLP